MNLFEAVKDSVTTRQAAESYGLQVKHGGMCRCPFHNDKTPSMKVDKRFHCFGCQADGDVIDFTARLFGLTPKDAAEKLAGDFGIAYETGKTFRSKPKHRQISDEEIFRHQVGYCYQALADYRNQLVQWQQLYEPQSPSDDFDSRFMEALMNLDFVEYQLDVLLFGEDFEKEQLVTDFLKNEHRYEEVSGMKPIVNTPVYHQSAAYAREHGELDQFRQSHQANIACKKDIEEAIFQNFDGFRLNKHAISGVLEKYGPERVGQVLAATVQVKAWDGRFSSANKDWAFTYDFPETHDMLGMDRRDDYAVTSHPAVLDGFINTARKEIAALEHPTYDTVEHDEAHTENCPGTFHADGTASAWTGSVCHLHCLLGSRPDRWPFRPAGSHGIRHWLLAERYRLYGPGASGESHRAAHGCGLPAEPNGSHPRFF